MNLFKTVFNLLISITLFTVEVQAQQCLKFSTEHFDVELDNSAAAFRPHVEIYLELGYRLFQKYTQIDYNAMMNPVDVKEVHKPRYYYHLPKDDEMWQKGWGGGLTYWNNSQMNANLVPTLDEKAMRENQKGLTVLWHELANGWANVYVSHNGKPTNVPWWFGAEGHAGFLRHQAMVEIGYPKNQIEEYKIAISHFDKYMNDEQYDPGSVCHVFLESIWQEYGWKPLRAVYSAIQNDGLIFPADDENIANGLLIKVMSQSVGQNMVLFFEKYGISVDEDTKTELQKLAKSSMKLAREILLER